jgi:hypothetical protein
VFKLHPDPSSVLAGVVYGPSSSMVGTLTLPAGGFDGSAKINLSTGKLVKIISNKAVISL